MALPNLADVPETGPVGEGVYTIRIIAAKEKFSERSGNEYLMLTLSIPDEPDSDIFNEIFTYPNGEDEQRDRDMERRLKKMCQAFDLPLGGIEPTEMKGAEAKAKLKVVKDFMDEDKMVNKISTFVS